MTTLTAPLSQRENLWRMLEAYKQMLDINNRVIGQELATAGSRGLPADLVCVLENWWGANVYFIAQFNDKQQIIEAVIQEECGLAQEPTEEHTYQV